MKNFIRTIFFIVIVVFYTPMFSQNLSEENAEKLGLYIIDKPLRVSSSLNLNNEEGVYLGDTGSFTIDNNSTLTIDSKLNVFQNRQLFFGEGEVLFNTGSVSEIDVTWFGAKPNDAISDVVAIQKAIDAAIFSRGVSVVYFPPGEYCIDKPLFAMRKKKYGYQFFNLTLRGHQYAHNNPGGKKGAVSVFKVDKEINFALGIQGARGVHIENLVFDGYIPPKNEIDDLIYKTSDELYKQDRYAPLSAIVIDPFSEKLPANSGYYKGYESYYDNRFSSSRIIIENTVIQNFPTGIAISPNGKTQQADSITIENCRFDNLINGIVICQTQSRSIIVENCSFHRMKYAFNADQYGDKNGILPEVNNVKIADGVALIYRVNGNVSYGHFRNVYAEALYGIGYSPLNKRPLNFDSCVFSFRPKSNIYKKDFNPCVLKADNASFTGCVFKFGGGKKNVEPLLMDVKKATFINCYIDSRPINIGSNFKKKNVSTFINNSLRYNKLKTSTWGEDEFSEIISSSLTKTSKKDEYYISKINGFKAGDYLFGFHKIKNEPFIEHPVYTALGVITKISDDRIYFKSTLNINGKNKINIIIK